MLFLLIIITIELFNLTLACDIFIISKCPLSPATVEHESDWELYCNNVREHVECINKKLKQCKRVQEYGPALETIKLTIKNTIEQGTRDHGCPDIIDKIKLPRIPRKKLTTKKHVTRKHTTESTTKYIDPNCNRNLIDMNCESLDKLTMRYLFDDNDLNDNHYYLYELNDLTCRNRVQFHTCMQKNFYVRCQRTYRNTFAKLNKLNANCIQYQTRQKMYLKSNGIQANFHFFLYSIILILNK
jgi:hypothetical protein